MSIPALSCSCIICREEKSSKGIHSHYRIAHTEKGKMQILKASDASKVNAKESHKAKQLERERIYYSSPRHCNNCDKLLDYESRHGKFCSHSCAASTTNKNRIRIKKVKTKLTKTKAVKEPKVKELKGAYCTIVKCKCSICSSSFYARSYSKYCKNCKQVAPNARAYYKFKFNIYDYPDLFDLSLLKLIGFYAPGGKSGKWNLDGLSRDHRVSVSEALLNNYDSYYISHPCNCELMPHKENDKKKGNSSISYTDLIIIVNEYDKTKCGTD